MKNRLITTRFMLLVTALISPLVYAHSGHDHQHWSSSIIHLLWILPAMIAIGIAIHLYRRKPTTQSEH
ncbi:hypothetical protein HWQ46_17335 [Shewanella sp. D64]|uniref:hypothetical protein n=1 Tax=unclassified Shewanella TaxID=196818 RepID=UPI0022BA1AEC|nr:MULTISPECIES: hypothetical protein [unclassified Shewanella]MEC4727313.1 hypothetical protein [Shewanella sp. D64]MEC4739468.1 hypothetical protein [Shewanella sp. E94]WBJ96797.1 hypothetical protein HWQ47_06670 [Shewanella sp. MTB7]